MRFHHPHYYQNSPFAQDHRHFYQSRDVFVPKAVAKNRWIIWRFSHPTEYLLLSFLMNHNKGEFFRKDLSTLKKNFYLFLKSRGDVYGYENNPFNWDVFVPYERIENVDEDTVSPFLFGTLGRGDLARSLNREHQRGSVGVRNIRATTLNPETKSFNLRRFSGEAPDASFLSFEEAVRYRNFIIREVNGYGGSSAFPINGQLRNFPRRSLKVLSLSPLFLPILPSDMVPFKLY